MHASVESAKQSLGIRQQSGNSSRPYRSRLSCLIQQLTIVLYCINTQSYLSIKIRSYSYREKCILYAFLKRFFHSTVKRSVYSRSCRYSGLFCKSLIKLALDQVSLSCFDLIEEVKLDIGLQVTCSTTNITSLL